MSGLRAGVLALTCGMIFSASLDAAETSCGWPAWNAFRAHFVSRDGRVIDPAGARAVTTSEGQAYALFFALVADDRAGFTQLLQWTENNLARGDLAAHLPAWQWGKRDDQSWGVLDDNSASDADLWLAYTLAEAGERWGEPRYGALAAAIAARILAEESVELPGVGRTLLPGARGFHPAADRWRLNPSYLALPLLRRVAARYPASAWPAVAHGAADLIVRSAPRGFAPDWFAFGADGGVQPDPVTHAVGSYDAIRVYLWAGMLDARDPARARLLAALRPMVRQVEAQGVPPLRVDTRTGAIDGVGPVGFSAALLPLLAATGSDTALQQQRARLTAPRTAEGARNYYDRVLTLFGGGWIEGRYRFAPDGALITKACAP